MSGINRLNIADASLQSITNLMVRARELTIQAEMTHSVL